MYKKRQRQTTHVTEEKRDEEQDGGAESDEDGDQVEDYDKFKEQLYLIHGVQDAQSDASDQEEHI